MHFQNPNINQIVAPLLKHRTIPMFDNITGIADIDLMQLIGNYLKAEHPNTYADILIDTNTSVSTALAICTNALFSLERSFETYDNETLVIEEPITFNEALYIIDIEVFNKDIAEPLKIGYAHMIKQLRHLFIEDILSCAELCDTYTESYDESPSSGESNTYGERIADVSEHFKYIEVLSEIYENLLKKDLAIFSSFKPKTKYERTFKTAVANVLNLDLYMLSHIGSDRRAEEQLHFNKCFMLVANTDNKHEILRAKSVLSHANWNGVARPVIATHVTKNDICNVTTKSQAENFLNQLTNALTFIIDNI